MSQDPEAFQPSRTERFKKEQQEETFLEELNRFLLPKELKEYNTYPIDHPFLFVMGLPRSGTTLTSQLISSTLEVGFINNLAARFYLAPLHGIRLSNAVLGNRSRTDFQSEYARTSDLSDIHEFGYFWRYWLKKESLQNIANATQKENDIDWEGLKKCLATLQYEFGKGMVFKNMFGAYHMKRLVQLLDKVLFIYIERDELDTACSILEARKQYHGDNLNAWWSYAPPEVMELIELDYPDQIAGQIVHLKDFFSREFKKIDKNKVVHLRYESLCNEPQSVINTICERASALYSYNFRQLQPTPDSFDLKRYKEKETKKIFCERIKAFREKVKKNR